MIELLIPLGLLGLLGILALIIIYIIKPNYQVKHISSTFVWKLSLRYRRRKLPTNTIRNILLFVCQLLILTSMAGILAKPVFTEESAGDRYEVIAVIDSSASMHTFTADGETRYDRAVDEAIDLMNDTFERDGLFSLIYADDAPVYSVRSYGKEQRNLVESQFEKECPYGGADADAAMTLCREVLSENPSAKVYFYTDTVYELPAENVEIVNVCAEGEWNAAILDATAELEDGYYTLTVQVACYQADLDLEVEVTVDGIDADGSDRGVKRTIAGKVFCPMGVPQTLIFRKGGRGDRPAKENVEYFDFQEGEGGEPVLFTSYRSIQIRLEGEEGPQDSYSCDDSFSLFGGQKEVVNVQYASSDPNPFVNSALGVAHNALGSRYDLRITEVKKGKEPETEGFDFYIFEHKMPKVLPTDGVVVLFDPDPELGELPPDLGFTVSGKTDLGPLTPLQETEASLVHPLMKNIAATEIGVSKYDVIDSYDESQYDVLMTFDTHPVYMACKKEDVQIAVLSFSVHFSDAAKNGIEWFILMYNLFDYYLPAIVDGNAFEVNESLTVNGRGESVTMTRKGDAMSPDDDIKTFSEFPAKVELNLPGVYEFDQTNYFGKAIPTLGVFVKTPARESDIWAREYTLLDPYEEAEAERAYDDLLIYLAAALVALLFAEWWLQSREGR